MCSYDFSNADWINLSAYLDSINFCNIFENCIDSEGIMNAFYTTLYDGLNQFVPVYSQPLYSNLNKNTYPYRIRRIINRKRRLWSIYRRLRTPESLSRYKLISAECRSAIYTFHVERENKIINSDNFGKFFSYANKKFKCKSTIGPLRSSEGSFSTEPIHKSELLQSVFRQLIRKTMVLYLHSLLAIALHLN
jgi:hypothetical protein